MLKYRAPIIVLVLFFLTVAVGLQTEVINLPLVTGKEKFGNFSLRVRHNRDLSVSHGGFAANWSPDGTKLVVVGNWGGSLTVWDNDGRKLGEKTGAGGGGPYLSRSVGFVDDDYHVVVEPVPGGMENEAFSVWNASPWQLVARVPGPQPMEGSFGNHPQPVRVDTRW